jgi:DNA polymerase-3 subunit delta'
MGKLHFAELFAASLLCKAPNPMACGHCKACHLRISGNHPDLYRVQPEEAGKMIQVDQIRQLLQFCTLTANYSRAQVIILQPAEAMNHNAANSLLKLLEEPPAKTLFLLVSHQPMALPATIRSRCQRVDFNRIESECAQQWLQQHISDQHHLDLLLKLTQGAPLRAQQLAAEEGLAKRQQVWQSLSQLLVDRADPIQIAMQWDKLDAKQVILWIQSWTMDFIRFRMTTQTQWVINSDIQESIQRFAYHFSLSELFKLLEKQQEVYTLLNSNLKTQGLLENIAILWQRSYHRL